MAYCGFVERTGIQETYPNIIDEKEEIEKFCAPSYLYPGINSMLITSAVSPAAAPETSNQDGESTDSLPSLNLTIDAFLDDSDEELDSLMVEKFPSTITELKSKLKEKEDRNPDLQCSEKMESAETRLDKSLNDIPHIVTIKLIKSLDTDMGWEVLAAQVGFNFEELSELTAEEKKMNGSAARKLLWKLGCGGYTVGMLHDNLKEIQRVHDAETVATYIMEGDRRQRQSPSQRVPAGRNTELLESMMSRISMAQSTNHSVQQIPGVQTNNSFPSPGSEVNFNQPYMATGTSQPVAGGGKFYENKSIPGASGIPVSMSHCPSPTPSYPGYPRHQPSQSSNCPGFSNPHHYVPGFAGIPSSEVSTHSVRKLPCSSTSTSQNPSRLPSVSTPASSLYPNTSAKLSFRYEELHKVTNGFDPSNCLGEGGFGSVFHGQLRNMDCAVKRFHRGVNENGNSLDQIQCELAALLKFQHENIVTLYGYALDGPELCLVYQYLSNGSLEDRLHRKNNTPPLPWERRLNILVGSCLAMNFLHNIGAPPLIHGDIKSANILLDRHMEAKLADLGQSKYATSSSSDVQSLTHITMEQTTQRQYGSVAYMAPEIKMNCRISIQSDVFAMGVVFFEVCSGMSAYDPNRHNDKFLTDLYSHVSQMGEADQLHEFQDKSPTDSLPPAVFFSILDLAKKCTQDIIKARPCSHKLMNRIKKIYDKQYKEQPPVKSPTEDDVTKTFPSFPYNKSGVSSPNCRSGDFYSNQSSHMHSVVEVQKSILEGISRTKHPSCHSSSSPSSSSPSPSFPSSSSSNSSVKQGCDYPVQEKLYDSRAKFSPQSRQSARDSSNMPVPYLLQSFYDSKCSISECVSTNLPGEGFSQTESSGTSLVSDPKKLASMKWFDENGFTKGPGNDGQEIPKEDSGVLKCNEAKLAYLNDFDEEAFRRRLLAQNSRGSETDVKFVNETDLKEGEVTKTKTSVSDQTDTPCESDAQLRYDGINVKTDLSSHSCEDNHKSLGQAIGKTVPKEDIQVGLARRKKIFDDYEKMLEKEAEDEQEKGIGEEEVQNEEMDKNDQLEGLSRESFL